ncbi:hypothetical protein Milano_119 [Agrobacterium phage Milano]|nr:hypothetical protein Milano_119 [Agrobacterium phage Milano]
MLIELKDGDTVIIGAVDIEKNRQFYTDICDSLGRGLSNAHFYYAPAEYHSVTVYRPSSTKDAPPVEKHDGWHSFESAPMDGQIFDAWVTDGERGNRRIPCVSFIKGVYQVHSAMAYEFRPIGDYGTPTHWRYPPQGPKA